MPNLQTLVVAALLAVAGNASAEVSLVPQDSGV
jgi:hypothetical protein